MVNLSCSRVIVICVYTSAQTKYHFGNEYVFGKFHKSYNECSLSSFFNHNIILLTLSYLVRIYLKIGSLETKLMIGAVKITLFHITSITCRLPRGFQFTVLTKEAARTSDIDPFPCSLFYSLSVEFRFVEGVRIWYGALINETFLCHLQTVCCLLM